MSAARKKRPRGLVPRESTKATLLRLIRASCAASTEHELAEVRWGGWWVMAGREPSGLVSVRAISARSGRRRVYEPEEGTTVMIASQIAEQHDRRRP